MIATLICESHFLWQVRKKKKEKEKKTEGGQKKRVQKGQQNSSCLSKCPLCHSNLKTDLKTSTVVVMLVASQRAKQSRCKDYQAQKAVWRQDLLSPQWCWTTSDVQTFHKLILSSLTLCQDGLTHCWRPGCLTPSPEPAMSGDFVCQRQLGPGLLQDTCHSLQMLGAWPHVRDREGEHFMQQSFMSYDHLISGSSNGCRLFITPYDTRKLREQEYFLCSLARIVHYNASELSTSYCSGLDHLVHLQISPQIPSSSPTPQNTHNWWLGSYSLISSVCKMKAFNSHFCWYQKVHRHSDSSQSMHTSCLL